MRLFRPVAIFSLVCLSLLAAHQALAKTAIFGPFTLEVPDDWKFFGTRLQMQSGDGSTLIEPANIVRTSSDFDASQRLLSIQRQLDEIKKVEREKPLPNVEPVGDYSTTDIDGGRQLVHRVYRVDPYTIAVVYYIVGPTYIVTFTLTSKSGINATIARMDPIFASLRWLGD